MCVSALFIFERSLSVSFLVPYLHLIKMLIIKFNNFFSFSMLLLFSSFLIEIATGYIIYCPSRIQNCIYNNLIFMLFIWIYTSKALTCRFSDFRYLFFVFCSLSPIFLPSCVTAFVISSYTCCVFVHTCVSIHYLFLRVFFWKKVFLCKSNLCIFQTFWMWFTLRMRNQKTNIKNSKKCMCIMLTE